VPRARATSPISTIDIKSVPVPIKGTKGLQPARHACRIEWRFDVTSGVPLLGYDDRSLAARKSERASKTNTDVLTETL
jgi:hypothetical protein